MEIRTSSGASWAQLGRHIGLSSSTLTRLRQHKWERQSDDFHAQQTTAMTITLTFEAAASTAEILQTMNSSIFENSNSQTMGEILATDHFRTPTNNEVILAVGSPSRGEGRQNFNHEAQVIRHALRGRAVPVVREAVSLAELHDAAVRRPFILHLAAHRSFGAVDLTGPDGERQPVPDVGLAKMVVPSQGAPKILILSFCGSVEVAQSLESEDVAIISFEGELTDDQAIAFHQNLYEAIRLGRRVGVAFEIGQAATMALGVTPRINAPNAAHEQRLSPN